MSTSILGTWNVWWYFCEIPKESTQTSHESTHVFKLIGMIGCLKGGLGVNRFFFCLPPGLFPGRLGGWFGWGFWSFCVQDFIRKVVVVVQVLFRPGKSQSFFILLAALADFGVEMWLPESHFKKNRPPINPSCFQVICHYLALEYLFPNRPELKTVKDVRWCETWGWFDADLFAACLWSLPPPHKKWQSFAPYHCGPRVLTCVIYLNVYWDVWV